MVWCPSSGVIFRLIAGDGAAERLQPSDATLPGFQAVKDNRRRPCELNCGFCASHGVIRRKNARSGYEHNRLLDD